MGEIRIEFSIKRLVPGTEDEYVEIGFGAADSRTVDGAAFEIGTCLQRREWETELGMPTPESYDMDES
jgi:hypothetical protein